MRASLGIWLACSMVTFTGWAHAAPKPAAQALPIQMEGELAIAACGSGSQGPAPVVTAESECVEVAVPLLHVSAPHRLRLIYYSPDGNLYQSTKKDWGFEPEAGKTGYHRRARITHRLPIRGEQASMLAGTWRVEARLDERHLAEGSFQLQGRPAARVDALETAKRAYLDLNYEEAIRTLAPLAASGTDVAAAAEAAWWLALSQNAMGQQAEARQTVTQLLQRAPTFSVSAEAAAAASGEEVAALLEEIRFANHPQLYKKTVAPPQVELSKAEEALVLEKRRRWYQKWWIYAIAGAVAVPVTAVLAKGEDPAPAPPAISLRVDASAERDVSFEFLCEGDVPLLLDISGGDPPFDALFTVEKVGGVGSVSIAGVGVLQRDRPVVVATRTFQEQGSNVAIALPTVEVVEAGFLTANVQFSAIVRDSRAGTPFGGITVGSPLPGSILTAVERDERIVQDIGFDVMNGFCRQN